MPAISRVGNTGLLVAEPLWRFAFKISARC